MLRMALDLYRFVGFSSHFHSRSRHPVWAREPHHLHQPVPQWHVSSLHQLGSASASMAIIGSDVRFIWTTANATIMRANYLQIKIG